LLREFQKGKEGGKCEFKRKKHGIEEKNRK
jgi:hypothetical protein